MPWINGHTKPMINAAMTGPKNNHDHRRIDFVFFKMHDLLRELCYEVERAGSIPLPAPALSFISVMLSRLLPGTVLPSPARMQS